MLKGLVEFLKQYEFINDIVIPNDYIEDFKKESEMFRFLLTDINITGHALVNCSSVVEAFDKFKNATDFSDAFVYALEFIGLRIPACSKLAQSYLNFLGV